jgi:hypothetical protein
MSNNTAVNIVDGLKGQHAQLRRLLDQQSWIEGASTNTLSEIETQLTQIRSVLAELQRVIGAQLAALMDQETVAQMTDRRELYRSPNGDCWYLVRDPISGHGFVVHEPNLPSGGRPSRIEITDFLRTNANGPEHQALLRIIGKIVTVPP